MTEVPPLPESLLVPLLDTAGEVLRGLEPAEVPAPLRNLASFGKRGMVSGTARHQLRSALETEDVFRSRVLERFLERPEVRAALEGWSPGVALTAARESARRDDLPLLASALVAGRPEGWAFGLGVMWAESERTRQREEERDDAKALRTRLASLDEARRRAEDAASDAAAEVGRLEDDLRQERRSRREREEQAARAADAARRHAEEADRQLGQARAATERAEARSRREAERVRAVEAELRETRQRLADTERELADKAEALARAVAPGSGLRHRDLQALTDAAELARRLADGLGGVAERARSLVAARGESPRPEAGGAGRSGDAGPGGGPPAAKVRRRAPVPVPPGWSATPRKGSRGRCALGTWSSSSTATTCRCGPGRRRARRSSASASSRPWPSSTCGPGARRRSCSTEPTWKACGPRRPGVRVVFSAPGEEADAVVVREVAGLPPHVPAVVVSSDRWVREHAEGEGALAVSADTLLAVLR
ncbi:MAG: NYN domain-containing protein [Acidimicrobiia bacterium]|nr:NYN domain-containing protein [Acidimicrobiia bacterium]